MKINVVHVIDRFDKINFGIWNAALINSTELVRFNVRSYVVSSRPTDLVYKNVVVLKLKSGKSLKRQLIKNDLNVDNTIVVSHGCWRGPTKVGFKLKLVGYNWIVVPHGMLEPWSMRQKRLKKRLYFLVEKRLMAYASSVRAVSYPEYDRLKKVFGKKVFYVPNCIIPANNEIIKSSTVPLRFLFLSRLHRKKGILPLVQAWFETGLSDDINVELIIAGPDDGELELLTPYIQESLNVVYVGPVYDKAKSELLEKSHIFLLPSFSEGFPTSVLEAMEFGLLPIISKGCNFPELFELNYALHAEPNIESLSKTLLEVKSMTAEVIIDKGLKSQQFVRENYSVASVSKDLFERLRQTLSVK